MVDEVSNEHYSATKMGYRVVPEGPETFRPHLLLYEVGSTRPEE